MQRRNGGFTLVELSVIIAIIVAVVCIGVGIGKIRTKKRYLVGREIPEPPVGQLIHNLAVDPTEMVTVAMPWKYSDKDEPVTDRRFLYSIANGYSPAMTAGTWGVKSRDGVFRLVDRPVMEPDTNWLPIVTLTNGMGKVDAVIPPDESVKKSATKGPQR